MKISACVRVAVVAFAAVVACDVVIPAAPVLARQIPPFGGQAALVADLSARRAKTMAAFGTDTVVVLSSAPTRVFSTDTDYEFRQESNLLYLTGLSEENITLVLVPGAVGPKEFLFIPAVDPVRELWNGRVIRADEAQRDTGVMRVFAQQRGEALGAFLAALLGATSATSGPEPVVSASQAAAATGAQVSKVAVVDADRARPAGASEADSDAVGRVTDVRRAIDASGKPGVTVVDASPAFRLQRQLKTPYEQRVLRRSVEISSEAHIEGMKVARPGRWEYEVEAAIEHWFLKSGALSWGYPSIVGSGPNATVLHYLKSTRQMQAGELLLVDAAANFQGLTGDITRTYPVSRQFSRDQRALYEVVSAALDAGIAAARPGGNVQDVERAVRAELGKGLLALGLLVDPQAATGQGRELSTWAPHSAVHGIGVDVHDPVGALSPGAAFVIEPGVYIRPDALERLAQDPATAAMAAAVRPAVSRFANTGIRLEDSFLMLPSGPENLSRSVPRQIRDVEAVVGTGR